MWGWCSRVKNPQILPMSSDYYFHEMAHERNVPEPLLFDFYILLEVETIGVWGDNQIRKTYSTLFKNII